MKKYVVANASKFEDEGMDVWAETFDSFGAAKAHMFGRWLIELNDDNDVVILPVSKPDSKVQFKAIKDFARCVGELTEDSGWVEFPAEDGEGAFESVWQIKEVRD